MTRTTRSLTVAAVAAAGALLASAPTTGAVGAAPAPAVGQSAHGYTPGSQDEAMNEELTRQVDAAYARHQARGAHRAAGAAAATITYDASQAPSYASYISDAVSIWNEREGNVQLVEDSSNAELTYYEGSDERGSYYSGDFHGNGYILIDQAQAQQYSPLRIVAHETGHALGLPDDYSGPCSELMSGGGPGPSCTNPNPNDTEVAKVDSMWADGFAPSLGVARQSGATQRAAFGK